MHKSTQELLHRLIELNDIQQYLEENSDETINETVPEYLNRLMHIKALKAADIAALSEQGDYVYKVFQGKRKAGRDVLLAIAIGMGLSIEQVQLLLRLAQTARLDPRNRRDSIIIYALNNTLSVEKTNDILFDMEEVTF